jgi:hypothetical protein
LALVALIVQVGFDVAFVTSTPPPAIDDGRDLLAFFTAGQIATDESLGPTHVYNPELQRSLQEELTGLTIAPGRGLPFIHPPYLLPVQRALAPLDYAEFWLRWSAVMVCLFLAGFAILDIDLGRAKISPSLRLAFLAAGLAFSPIIISLIQGQDTALLYVAVAGWMAAFSARRDILAGLALSLATVRPHIALVLALPFLFARRRVLVGFVIGSALLLGWFLVQVGPGGLLDYGRTLLGLASGSGSGVGVQDRVNLTGILERLLPESSGQVARYLGWGLWLAMTAWLCVLWDRRGRSGGPELVDLGFAIVLAVAFAPHMNYHDLSLIHAAAAPALVVSWKRGGDASGWLAIASLVGISLVISLALLSGFPLHDLLLAACFGIALALLTRAGARGSADQDASPGVRSIA